MEETNGGPAENEGEIRTCMIEATVVSGFEEVAAEEIRQKLGVEPRPLYDDYETFKGHLFFRLSESAVPSLSRLQTVDNLFVLATPNSAPSIVPATASSIPSKASVTISSSVDSSPQENPVDQQPDLLPPPAVEGVLRLHLPVDDVVPCLLTLRHLPAKIEWKRVFSVWRKMFPERLVDYQLPELSEAEMEAFFNAEPEEEWSGNVSWINPRLEKTKTTSKKKKKGKRKKKESGPEEEGKETEIDKEDDDGEQKEDHTKDENTQSEQKDKKEIEVAKNSENSDQKPVFDGAAVIDVAKTAENSALRTKDDADATRKERGALKAKNEAIPTFRATCYRGQPSGEKHAFTSQDAAKVSGGAIQSVFQWNVNMTEFDVEVVLNISGDFIWVTLALTRESMHRRHIKHFGPTTLRSTIAMNLVKFSGLKDGETLCDPLCGGGGIPIEAAYEWPQSLVFAGDSHEQAFQRTLDNIAYNDEKRAKSSLSPLRISVFRWDATLLPLRSESVDVFVTDLPFGKRSGSKTENRILYPRLLNEFARVAKLDTGRAVFLTEDKTISSRRSKPISLCGGSGVICGSTSAACGPASSCCSGTRRRGNPWRPRKTASNRALRRGGRWKQRRPGWRRESRAGIQSEKRKTTTVNNSALNVRDNHSVCTCQRDVSNTNMGSFGQ